MKVRLADVRVPGRLEPSDRLSSAVWQVVGEQDRAVGRAQTGRIEQVLHGQADALGDLLRPGQEDGHAATLAPISNRAGVRRAVSTRPGL